MKQVAPDRGAVTMFGAQDGVARPMPDVPQKRPRRWSLRNWPVRRKVFAIVLLPLVLALAFGGARIYAGVTSARSLHLAVDRAQMIPVIEDYLTSLQGALLAYSAGGDTASASKTFQAGKTALQTRVDGTDVAADVRRGVTTLLDDGQKLIDATSANTIGLRERITTYAPILLTAEDAINGSVRIDDEKIRAQARGLSRAVGARGQMFMQQLLLDQGGDLPEPELRTSMITVAGTEPSTIFDMSQVLGVDSADTKTLQAEMVRRQAILADPEQVLVGNLDLRQSLQATDTIAAQIINRTTPAVTAAVQQQAIERRAAVIRDAVGFLIAFVIALLVVWLVARSLIRPLRTLRDSALKVAHTDLEQEIARARAGDEREPEPLPIHTTEEVGQVAHAVDELHIQALLLAGDEARLRLLVNDMFETMSRRNRSLVDQQLALIDRLERNEKDPERLESLFRLDHLATRMRRIGANLLVLAGAQVSRDHRQSMPLAAAVTAALSEVEDYKRVEVGSLPDSALIGRVAGDTVHMLAELIDNALRYSPPIAPVRVSAVHTSNAGVLIEIHDDGIGMTDGDLRIANMRLEAGGEATPDNARHMGLFVVSRLSHMHGMVVRLRNSVAGQPSSGTTAELYVPAGLLEHASPIGADARPFSEPGPEPEPASDQPRWFGAGEPAAAHDHPSDTSSFFGSRSRVEEVLQDSVDLSDSDELAADLAAPGTDDAPDTDLIYQRMLSEFLVDPHKLAVPQDWKSVWDSGWTAAAEVENVPVAAQTDHGLPVREPGARLVPGGAESMASPRNGGQANGAPPSERDPAPGLPQRDPGAVRAFPGDRT